MGEERERRQGQDGCCFYMMKCLHLAELWSSKHRHHIKDNVSKAISLIHAKFKEKHKVLHMFLDDTLSTSCISFGGLRCETNTDY